MITPLQKNLAFVTLTGIFIHQSYSTVKATGGISVGVVFYLIFLLLFLRIIYLLEAKVFVLTSFKVIFCAVLLRILFNGMYFFIFKSEFVHNQPVTPVLMGMDMNMALLSVEVLAPELFLVVIFGMKRPY